MDQELDQSENPKYFLGIDWGASRVGLAIGDDVMKIATGLEEITTEDAVERIKRLDAQYDFAKFILGIPQHKNFAPKKELENFLEKLEGIGKEVVEENESFSTKMAQVNLVNAGRKGVSHGDNVEAARLILQGFLDRTSKK